MRKKTVFGVSDQLQQKQSEQAVTRGLEISDVGSRGIVLCLLRKEKEGADLKKPGRFSHHAAHSHYLYETRVDAIALTR